MDQQSQSKRLWRLSAMGFTFVSMIIAGGLLGLLLVWALGRYDPSWLIHKKAFIVGGSVCGIIFGMVDFIRDALKAIHKSG
jgi:MFS family permease